MNRGDLNLACAWALVDELVRAGVRHACLSPGSRSTALVLALARHPGIELHIHLDERSSGFIALGIAKALGRPVAVACTSGTAAAELFPAVVEASQAGMPLLVLTADRPPRLRGTGANQTIDQVELYGRYARGYFEPPVPVTDEDIEAWGAAGREAVAAAASLPIGPAHVNCPVDEPLTPGEVELPQPGARRQRPPGPKPWEDLATPDDVERVAGAISGRRGVIVAGPRSWEDSGDVGVLADRLGWPLLAEPLSGLRRLDEGLRAGQPLRAGQALLTAEGWLDARRPEVVLQVGAAPTTRATQDLVGSGQKLIVIDIHHLEPDPEGRATIRLHVQPGDVVNALGHLAPAPFGWRTEWEVADEAARIALDDVLDAEAAPNGLRTARDVAAAIPESGILLVGNSLPVRDLDLSMAPRDGLRVLGNRGASGIDGLISTSVGIATARRGPTYALLGDLSFLHDLGALAWSARHEPPDITLVVVNNGGGQVFSLLPQRELPEHERLFVTPHHADLEALTRASGAAYVRVEAADDLVATVAEPPAGIRVVEVVVDADHDRRVRDDMRAAVGEALARLP